MLRKSPQAQLIRREVYEGRRHATEGGLTKADLMVNKRGRIVSKAAHEQGKKMYNKNNLAVYQAEPFTKGSSSGRKKSGHLQKNAKRKSSKK